MVLTPSASELFYSRNDVEDPRLGDLTRSMELEQALKDESISKVLLGYADDEGIRLNGGRPGASAAPHKIRHFLYRMTPGLKAATPYLGLADVGDLHPTAGAVHERHEAGRLWTRSLHQSGRFVASLGGGHDYGYSDVSGFLDAYSEKNPLVLNIDAHLDVRPVKNSVYHSGTPFFRVLTEFKNKLEFVEYGIQDQCNAKAHIAWAKAQGARVIDRTEARSFSLRSLQGNGKSPRRPAFLSLDIDGLSNQLAPGCSQSWNQGLDLTEVLTLIDDMIDGFDLRGVGIYEVSPPLDVADRTSKLAAEILHHIFYRLETDRV